MSAQPCDVHHALRRQDRGRRADLVPALIMAAGAFAAVVVMTVFVTPPGGPVAVVFPPWSGRHANWAAAFAAEGVVVDERLGGTVLVVQPGPDRDPAGFTGRILHAGAWAVVNPLAFGGCGGDETVPPAHSSTR